MLLGHSGRIIDPLLISGDRLVLDPVVGGEVAVEDADTEVTVMFLQLWSEPSGMVALADSVRSAH